MCPADRVKLRASTSDLFTGRAVRWKQVGMFVAAFANMSYFRVTFELLSIGIRLVVHSNERSTPLSIFAY